MGKLFHRFVTNEEQMKPVKKLKCIFCDYAFVKVKNLNKHMKEHRGNSDSENQKKRNQERPQIN